MNGLKYKIISETFKLREQDGVMKLSTCCSKFIESNSILLSG